MSEENNAAENGEKQTHSFQAEVQQVLQLVIHSLYSNKEIFLRELISNASDACDKLRFEGLENEGLYEGDSELRVELETDEEAGTLTIRDNGIGMTRDEVIENIGTIARSGTKKFIEALSADQAADSQMIGQFGVGFYSAFIVADNVRLTTRRAGSEADSGVCWESNGEGSFTLEDVGRAGRGTEIVLTLREDAKEFLQRWRIQQIVSRYSDHINLPIKMLKEEEPAAPEGDEEAKPADDVVTVPEWEAINDASALWTKPKSEISEEDYKNFYKHVSHDYGEPLLWSHNRVEGKLEYTSLLYIPKKAPMDMFDRDQSHGVKLYVQRVFIMDEADKLMPRYLRFVKGLVDSNDLPLNVSRELLQSNKVIDSIRSGSTKKVLGALEQLAKKDAEGYQAFWDEFGTVMKEGPIEDFSNRDQVAKLLRFATTKSDGEKATVSLADYIERMQPEQDKIYYVIADSHKAAASSPHLEVFKKHDVEVLLLSDRVDEWLTSHLTQFEEKTLVSVAKGGLDLAGVTDKDSDDKDADDATKPEDNPLLTRVKDSLAEQVQDVVASKRLVDSPACLVVGEYDMSRNMQEIMRELGQSAPASKPTLELNLEHPLVQKLDKVDDSLFADWSELLYEQAVLAEGGSLNDPGAFIKRMNSMMLTMIK